jgi:hypothetical protein
MRCMSTEPTIPRQPTIAVFTMLSATMGTLLISGRK